MDQAFINLSIGLLILIVTNIALGSLEAVFERKFDFKTFFKGVAKGAIVAACTAGVYYAGILNPDIIAIDVGGQEVTILTAINLVVLGGYYFYAKQVFVKLTLLLKAKQSDKED